jgi:hypothetical protein
MKIEYLHASKYGNGAMVAAEFEQQMAANGVRRRCAPTWHWALLRVAPLQQPSVVRGGGPAGLFSLIVAQVIVIVVRSTIRCRPRSALSMRV